MDDKKAALERRAKDLVNEQTEAARKAAEAAKKDGYVTGNGTPESPWTIRDLAIRSYNFV